MIRSVATPLTLVTIALSLAACADDGLTVPTDGNSVPADTSFSTPDWTAATHGKGAVPDFDVVFADNTTKRLDIVLTAERCRKAITEALWRWISPTWLQVHGP
jgi:hypothetical protein